MDFELYLKSENKIDAKARLIKSPRGKPQILYNGYSFRQHRELAGGATSWRCTKPGCFSRFRVETENDLENLNVESFFSLHNHESNQEDNDLRTLRSLVKEKAKLNPTLRPKIVIDMALKELGMTYLFNTESLERVITRWRNKHFRASSAEEKETENFDHEKLKMDFNENYELENNECDFEKQQDICDFSVPNMDDMEMESFEFVNFSGRISPDGLLDLSFRMRGRPFLNPIVIEKEQLEQTQKNSILFLK